MSQIDTSQYLYEAKKKGVAEQQKSIRISKKWAIFMVCCSFLYLFPEAIFNSMLVTVVGGADNTPYSREDVEIFGRAISGIGVTLLVADLLIGRLYKRGNLKGLTAGYFYLICIGVLTWPTVYFGQKWLIDEYLIHPSTAEERQFAMFSQMVNSGVIENAIEIDGIPFNANDELTPQEMSFLGVFPSLMYVNDSAFRNIKSQQSTIASKYFQNKFYGGFDKYYENFKSLREEFATKYKEYRVYSDKYVDSLNGSVNETNKVLSDIDREMHSKHLRVVSKNEDFEYKARSNAKKMAKDYYKFMDTRRRLVVWKEVNKIRRHDAKFAKKMVDEGFAGVSHEYFLMDGNKYSDDPEHMRKKLLGLMYAKFERQEGFPPYLSYNEFIAHPKVNENLRIELLKEGLELKSGWTLRDKRSLQIAVHNKMKKEADIEWNKNPTVQELGIKPNLTWEQFYSSAGVQTEIKELMNASGLTQKIDLNWNNVQFKSGFIDPMISLKTNDLIKALNASIVDFEDGGKYVEPSKNALRATLVPPISMGLSLFLVVMTAFKLPLKVLNLFEIKNSKVKIGKKIAPYLMIALIVLVPFGVSANVTRQNSTVTYLLDNVKSAIHPVSAYSLEWLIKAQPLFYPVGIYLENTLSLSSVVSGLGDELRPTVEVKEKKTPISPPVVEKQNQKVVKELPKKGPFPLRIETNPFNARVRVMNITPKYYDGIKLPVGRYDVEVSANGYKTKREYIDLNQYSSSFVITLSRN